MPGLLTKLVETSIVYTLKCSVQIVNSTAKSILNKIPLISDQAVQD